MFYQCCVSLFDECLVLFRNLAHFVDGTHRVVVEIEHRFAVYDIELAFEIIFLAERNQNRPRICAEFFVHRVDRGIEVSADAIHFVDERDARDIVFVRLAPDRF